MKADLTPRRLFTCVILLLAVAAIASGCGGGVDAQSAATTDPSPVKYPNSYLRFTHTASRRLPHTAWWKASRSRGGGGRRCGAGVYLGPQRVHDPCSMQGNALS